MKKRMIAITLSLFVIVAMFPLTGFAASKIETTSSKYYRIVDGSEYLAKSETYKYDKKGRLVQSTWMNREYFNYDVPPGTKNDPKDPYYKQYKNTTKNTYGKKGRIITTMVYVNGKFDAKNSFKYDKKGRVTKSTKYIKKKGKYKVASYSKHVYSKKKHTVTTYDVDGKKLDKIVDTLGSKKRVMKNVIYVYNSSGKVADKYTTAYTYWKNGKVKTEKYTNKTFGSTTKYNSKGRITSYEEETSDGDHYIERYTYDNYGRTTKLKTTVLSEFVGDGEDEFTPYSNETTYKYSGYFKSKKYPKIIKEYYNGAYSGKTVCTYKKF